MTLKDDIISDLDTVFDDWADSFTAKLSGATVKQIDGIFEESVETVSPYEAESVVFRPAVSFKTADFNGLDKTHTFTRDADGVVYRIYGEPQPEGVGMTRVALVKA